MNRSINPLRGFRFYRSICLQLFDLYEVNHRNKKFFSRNQQTFQIINRSKFYLKITNCWQMWNYLSPLVHKSVSFLHNSGRNRLPRLIIIQSGINHLIIKSINPCGVFGCLVFLTILLIRNLSPPSFFLVRITPIHLKKKPR